MTARAHVGLGGRARGEPFDFWPQPATIEKNNFQYKSLSNWAFNISVGCSHACRFCYVPSTSTNKQGQALKGFGVADPDGQWGEYSLLRKWDEGEFIRSLKRAENTPAEELSDDGNRAVIYCSTTDPYQVFRASTPEKQGILQEARRHMVRRSLELILEYSTLNVRILTRSPLAKEDFDLYEKFGDRLLFGMSLPTLRADLAKLYEPKAPGPAARLKVLREAKERAIRVFVALAPTPPESEEADLRETLQAIAELDPVTIFHEPINIRAENVARIRARADGLGVTFHGEVFASTGAWAHYAIGQLMLVQRIADEMGLVDRLKLWPDATLATFKNYIEAREYAAWDGRPPYVSPAALGKRSRQYEKTFKREFLPWVKYWHGVVSAWPGGRTR